MCTRNEKKMETCLSKKENNKYMVYLQIMVGKRAQQRKGGKGLAK